MDRPTLSIAVLVFLFGATGGFVMGHLTAPRLPASADEMAALDIRASKLAGAEEAARQEWEMAKETRVITVKQTFASEAYSCVPATDDGRGTVQATCADMDGNVVARVEQRFDDHPANQGIVESIDVVLTVAGQDKRYPVKKFWNEYRSPSCRFTYLDDSSESLNGSVDCVANDRDGGTRLGYTFDTAKGSMKLLYDCSSKTKVSGDMPLIATTTETCKNYAEPQ